MTIPDFISNALDRHYSLEQAAADLGRLMLERDLIDRAGYVHATRLRELDRLIPMQEALILRKLRGDEIFDPLAQLKLRVESA